MPEVVGDSCFCKWEFGAPMEHSKKPTNQKRKERTQPKTSTTTNPPHWSRKCFSGHRFIWFVPLSACSCSGFMHWALFLLLAFLRLSKLPLLSFWLSPHYPAVASCPCGPCPARCANPWPACRLVQLRFLKRASGCVQILFPLHKGIGVYSKCSCSSVPSCYLGDKKAIDCLYFHCRIYSSGSWCCFCQLSLDEVRAVTTLCNVEFLYWL